MNDIQKIANSMDDDDLINEMALTTGAIPTAPLGDAGFKKQSVKKKQRKKPKKYKANPQGQPEDGAILFSGIEDEKHIKEAGEKRKRPRRRRKPQTEEELYAAIKARKAKAKTEKELFPARDWAMKRLPNIFRTGGIEELSNMDRDEFIDLNRRVEGNQILRSARSELHRVTVILKQLDTTERNCRLLIDYNKIENLRNIDVTAGKLGNAWDPEMSGSKPGINMPGPIIGWWGIRHWDAAQINIYMRLYIGQIYFKYIQEVRLLLNDHMILCDMIDCSNTGHSPWLSTGYCTGVFDTNQGEHYWTLGKAVEEMALERRADFNLFRRRSRGKIRPEPPEDTTEKEMRQAKRARGENIDLYKDYGANWRQFFDRDI